jgi:UDP-GlcNAc:undecaprenyl-phosphate GlcNAc-1-phosphate transferase
VLVGASRASFRLLGEALRTPHAGARPVLDYGAGDGGELALRELRNNAGLARDVRGFIDDDRPKAGTRIHGVPVLGPLDELEALLWAHPVEEGVVASREIPTERGGGDSHLRAPRVRSRPLTARPALP